MQSVMYALLSSRLGAGVPDCYIYISSHTSRKLFMDLDCSELYAWS